ncbi:MAG TPA: hypothetical protein DEB31_03655 [Clostridiales bacterium]|nr:hypothetical protein [Clostridiales bacterium]
MHKLYKKVLAIISAIENNSVFSSVKKGFVLLIPLLLIGAIALMLRNFPAEAVQQFYAGAGAGLFDLLLYIYNATFGFISAYLVLSVSYYYSFTFHKNNFSLQVTSMIVAFLCFLATFGGAPELTDFGSLGVFSAIICGLLGPKLFFAFLRLFRGKSRSHAFGADMDFRNTIIAIVPIMMCLAVFLAFHIFLNAVFGVRNLNELIANGLAALFENMVSGPGSGILFLLMLNLLWFFGIHAGNAFDYVSELVFVPANEDPSAIVSKTFMDNFALIGGSGAVICLLLALLIAARTKSSRQLSFAALPTAIFNINEILVYGLPVVLNPVMLIPFITVPIVSLLIAYGATAVGLLPVVTETVNWTTPPFISGYLATGGYGGAVAQAVIIAVGTAIYVPFVRLSEKIQYTREVLLVGKMTEKFAKAQNDGIKIEFLDTYDDLSVTAKGMLSRLRADVAKKKVALFYQP